MYKTEFTQRAREDVNETLLSAIELYNGLDEKFDYELNLVLDLLEGQPRLGKPREDGLREIPLSMFKKMIVYHLKESEKLILIVRVIPMKSDWKDKKYTLH